MKIIQLITDSKRRGAQVFAGQLSDGLQRRGHQVLVVALYSSRDEGDCLSGAAMIKFLGGKRKLFSIRLLMELRKVIREFSPEIIQANGSDTLKYMVLATLWMKARPVLIYRNISMVGQWVSGGAKRRFYRYLFNKLDAVISLTRGTMKDLVSVYNIEVGRIHIIPIGVPPPVVKSRNEARLSLERITGITGKKILVHIGSMTQEKNHLGLLRIFESICDSLDQAVLIMVGDGHLRDQIQLNVQSMRHGANVHWIGIRQDIYDWLGGADILLLPSTIEGLPGVVLEAMINRVPVVAYKVGALEEVIDSGTNGLLIECGDEKSFASMTIQLLGDEHRRNEMGDLAFSKVYGRYVLNGIVEEFERLYGSMLPGGMLENKWQ